MDQNLKVPSLEFDRILLDMGIESLDLGKLPVRFYVNLLKIHSYGLNSSPAPLCVPSQ
jgi:hypothetical protein